MMQHLYMHGKPLEDAHCSLVILETINVAVAICWCATDIQAKHSQGGKHDQ